MNLRRFFTFFLSTLLFAGVVSAEFTIQGLPTTGRCTAASFGRGPGDQSANRPDQSYQTKIGNISADKSGDNIVVSFKGVTPLFAGSGHSYWDEETQSWKISTEGNDFLLAGMGVRAFPVMWRCDENRDSGWTIIGSADSMVRTTDTSALISLTDSSATTPSVYWYIATSLVNASDASDAKNYLIGGYCGGDTCDEEAYPAPDNNRTTLGAYNTALMAFNSSTETSKMNWADPIAVSINTLPKQELAFGLDTSTNSTTVMTATTLGQSVSASFVATIDSYYASTPAYTWTTTLKVNGTDTNITDSGLIFNSGGNQFFVNGAFHPTKVGPASYDLAVAVNVKNGSNDVTGTTTTLAKTYSWLVKPQPITITSAAGPHTVEIGTSETFTLSSDYGYSKYATDKATAEFVIVTNLATGVGAAAVNGNVLTVNLADNQDNATNSYNITLRAQDSCKTGQTCDPNLMTTGENFTFTVYAKPHEFDFTSDIRTKSNAFVIAPMNPANWEKFRHNVTDTSRISFEIGVNENAKNGYNIYLTGISGAIGSTPITTLSQINMDFATAPNTAAVLHEISANSSIASTGATFALSITAVGGQDSSPGTTSVTLGFVILDGRAPSVVVAAWEPFDWAGYVDAARRVTIPVKDQNRTLTVYFDEPMCEAPGLQLMSPTTTTYGSPLAGSLSAPSPVITYSYNFKDWTANTEQTFRFKTDNTGKDCQPAGLTTFFADAANSSVASLEYTSKVVKPMALVVPNLVDVSPFNSFELTFTKPLAASMTDTVLTTAFEAPLMNPFYATKVSDSVVRISPVTRFEYESSGFTLIATRILDSEYYPMVNASGNVANQTLGNTQLKIGSDTYAPKLVNRSITANARTTAVTFVFNYDESVSFVECTPADFCVNRTGSSVNKIVISTVNLAYNTEYNVTMVVADSAATPNRTTEQIKWVTMIAEEADAVAQPVADTEKPYLVKMTPDLRDADFAANVPLVPELGFFFNEVINLSALSMNVVKGADSIPALPAQTFDNGFVLRPAVALVPGTVYKLEISGIKDLSNNDMLPVTYSFVTVPAVVQKSAPVFAGAAFSYVAYGAATTGLKPVAPNANLIFYFDQTINVQSLSNAFTLTSAADNVSGSFVADGKTLVFTPSRNLQPAATYAFTFKPGISGLFENATTGKTEGSFVTRVDTEIRDFNIIARNSTGDTHSVTASWRNPLDINATDAFFRLTAKLSDTFSFASAEPARTQTVAYSANAAKMTTGFSLTGAGGKNLQVIIEACNGTSDAATCVATATAETYGLLASAPAASVATETFVSKASSAVVSVALAVKENKTVPPVTIKVAPSALPFSTPIAVSEIPAAQKTALIAKPGSSSRLAEPVQFGPDGLVFEEPVDVALSFDPQSVIAGIPSAGDLLSKMQGLVYMSTQQRWTASGIAKSRVELISNNEALLWLRVPHFSVISASVALAFAPANEALVELNTDETKSVTLSWDKNIQTSSVRYSMNLGNSVEHRGFTTNANSAIIDVKGLTMGDATYTVEICDDAVYDCASTPSAWISTSLTFRVVSEESDFVTTDFVRSIDDFTVYLSASGTAYLSWVIPAADQVSGSKTILDVEIHYRKSSDENFTLHNTFNRAVNTTTVSGLDNVPYVWMIRAKNGNQYAVDKEYRFTSGLVELTAASGNVSALSGNVRVVPNSTALLNAFKSVGVLENETSFKVGGTTLEIAGNGLVDLNFSGAINSTIANPASAKITLDTTGINLVLYHYKQNLSTGVGSWQEMPTEHYTPALKYVWYNKTELATTTEFTVYSIGGEGSPFAVAPKISAPVVYRSGGGGGCSVAGGCCDEEHAGSWINFLLMLMPLGYLLLRKMK